MIRWTVLAPWEFDLGLLALGGELDAQLLKLELVDVRRQPQGVVALDQPVDQVAEPGFEFRFSDSNFGFRFSVFGFRVSVFQRFRVSGFGFRTSVFGVRVSGLLNDRDDARGIGVEAAPHSFVLLHDTQSL